MQTEYKAIIVDDEESARNILTSLLTNFYPEIHIVEKCTGVEEAVLAIKNHKPDIVFLDIEMPNYAGYEIVSFFKSIDFDIIFVTAYDHYAVKAFEVSAIDYLLKPIEISKLKSAISRFFEKKEMHNKSVNYEILVDSLQNECIKKIVIPHQGFQKVIHIDQIIALEANESYCYIYTLNEKRYMVSKKLKHYENLFDKNKKLMRTHKSWIVNIDHIVRYSKSDLLIELKSDINAKLSKYKKAAFEEFYLK